MATVAVALGTAFGASGAAAATLGSSILGGLVSGIGGGLMKRAEAKEARREREAKEQFEIDEEKRAEQSYSGVGQSTRFWEKEAPTAGGGIDPDYQREQPQQYGAGVDSNYTKPQQQPGERFRSSQAAQKSRPFYNRETRRIQYS